MSGANRIAWVARSCRPLAATAAELEQTRQFAELTIGASIHLEPKTAARMRAPPVPPEIDARVATAYLELTRSRR